MPRERGGGRKDGIEVAANKTIPKTQPNVAAIVKIKEKYTERERETPVVAILFFPLFRLCFEREIAIRRSKKMK